MSSVQNARSWLVALVLSAVAASSLSAQIPRPATANPAVVPLDRLGEGWWADRHKAIVSAGRSNADTQLLLLGDSITNNYDKSKLPDENFQPTWQTFYAPRHALNLGFSGDTTENLLWRLDHGEVEVLQPKVALVLIGTNNTGGTTQSPPQTAEQTEVGIDAVVARLETKLPKTHILLLGILPSDVSANKTSADLAVNRYLANSYGENPRVTYLDIGSIFRKQGMLDTSIFYDPRLPAHRGALHPDTVGQRRMAEAIEPTLARLMDEDTRVPLNAMVDINTSLIPVPWLEQDSYDWFARHNAELAQQKMMEHSMQPRVVLIGDSITHFWGGLPHAAHVNGPSAWSQTFGTNDSSVLNMGFGWDRTQNVLWRLRQGELSGLTPQWVVLMIGTNNLTSTNHARANTPEEIVEGIRAVIEEVRRITPQSHVILMAILPRGEKPDYRLRAPIAETNALLKGRFGGDSSLTYLDIGAKFLTPDGTLPKALMPDGTHPSDAGYQIWGNALSAVFNTKSSN
ncbi:GDSL-type esterase/lipase family protein [Granulicella paludicola]|uniref:GDSL-type esterase/lipase family protein n=1 Tax=Granulicella paludicola TaxID=474951 RepID=UPI0021E070F9|nr:GDSL-type esterase/lipase family protein [Granulicella paludicola]